MVSASKIFQDTQKKKFFTDEIVDQPKKSEHAREHALYNFLMKGARNERKNKGDRKTSFECECEKEKKILRWLFE